ncbi:hypothetical protein RIR_e72112_A0A2I1FL52_9GLOM [Rhizophagus irregularis DAOM 181602=DAOM 197198]|nr:hypothetical protein RIR_e72112_A0A2I1FL52_9GLOM [Rhizophagus irregularis DAOM 181602=DAOM 197198]
MASNIPKSYLQKWKIYSPNGLEYLSAENQIHEMLNITKNLLLIDVFNELCESLKSGVEYALNGFVKWIKV